MQQVLIKDLLFDNDCREKLISGIQKVAKAVGSTMGPMGKTVLIESPEHTKSITVTKDGYQVAKSIYLHDPVENMAATIIKEVSAITANEAGDGTTTATVLAESLIIYGNALIKDGINQTQVLRYLSEIANIVIEQLKSDAIPCNDDILLDVATISANNDEKIGKLIADTYMSVGKNGIVSISNSSNHITYSEATSGLRIERGYSSPMFVNSREKDQCIMEEVYILVCDSEISNFTQLDGVLKDIVKERKKLLIVAPCTTDLVNTFAMNVIKNNITMCTIQPPSFGYKQHELMDDIALSVGAKYFSQQTGDDLSLLSMSDLGFAERVVISKNKTEIIGKNGDETEILKRVEQLTKAKENTKTKAEKDFIDERIASLTGGVAIIYVGGNTDVEQKELYDRMEDAVCAVKAAIEEGILPGSGLALYDTEISQTGDANFEVAKTIMLNALKRPLEQIFSNADMVKDKHYHDDKSDKGYGCNLKTGEWGNLIEMGVIDPLKVIRTALLNAVSVATTILSTNASINIARA